MSVAVSTPTNVQTNVQNTTYQRRALDRLELPKVLARLESLCACDLGRARVAAIVPSNQNAQARVALALTSEAKSFTEKVRFPPFGGLSDVSEPLKIASVGAILDPQHLLAVGRAVEGARRLRQTLFSISEEIADQFDRLLDLAEAIVPRTDVEKAIFDAVDDNGEIKDDASLDLLKARRNIRSTQSQIQTRLRQMLSDTRVAPHLQDAFVTVRDGRYCLPVKAESRGSVPGIVHDRSASGGAFFIEPQAVVDLNNRLRELAGEEREAILDIQRTLSGYVGGAYDDLKASLDAAGELDFAFAKAQLSIEMQGMEANLRDDVAGAFLKSARHPLVEGCVANDIKIGDESAMTKRGDFDVMMLTGPNTGGKTVVLKTLGLLTAMTGCGLHIPVDAGSWLSLPPQIHVDIGDEQSIEQSLSTFSGHLRNIVGILKSVQPNDLVLFDEIGAGTDPDEGAALAKAVLRTLSRRGAKVLATTHYGELKQFALSAGRFENASVEFDPESLRPTYHLRIGVPGASNALDIAARLGMPPELVQRARRYLGAERGEVEAATQQLEATQRQLTQQSEDAQREREILDKLRREYEGRLQRIERDKEKEVENARREARELVEKASREADEALRELRRAARAGQGGENKDTEAARGRLRTLRERVVAFGGTPTEKRSGGGEERPARKPRSERPGEVISPAPPLLRSSSPPIEPPKPGQIVRLKTLDREGEVLRVENGRVEVRVGLMKVEVKLSDLEAAPAKNDTVRGVAAIQARKSWTVEKEINIIGQDTVSALDQLERYIDDAILAELKEVRIVHGRGSGALRTAVHRFLRGHRAVAEFDLAPQNEGGEGATVVKLG